MKRLCLILFAFWSVSGQNVIINPVPRRLPGGAAQREAIIADDYKKNLDDSIQLARLSREVRIEFQQSNRNIVSVTTLKKLDEIEKLTRNIRGRLKRY
jgi:hypothetical protein